MSKETYIIHRDSEDVYTVDCNRLMEGSGYGAAKAKSAVELDTGMARHLRLEHGRH